MNEQAKDDLRPLRRIHITLNRFRRNHGDVHKTDYCYKQQKCIEKKLESHMFTPIFSIKRYNKSRYENLLYR